MTCAPSRAGYGREPPRCPESGCGDPVDVVDGCSSRFIPISSIGDFWIQEGFYGFKVRFYLVVVKGGRRACGGGVCSGFSPLAN